MKYFCDGIIIDKYGFYHSCLFETRCKLFHNHLNLMESTPKGAQVKLPEGKEYNKFPSFSCDVFEMAEDLSISLEEEKYE